MTISTKTWKELSMPTDTSERGLESLIVDQLTTEQDPDSRLRWVDGSAGDYKREYAIDWAKLHAFLSNTQPELIATLGLGEDGSSQTQFLNRLQGEITRRGVIDVIRKGIKHGPSEVTLFFGTPTPGNVEAARMFAANIFSVTRQLRYSRDETRLALDLALFINGLPIATFELKNSLTKQTVDDAVRQYQSDRDPKELLFQPGRCAVHFAVDEHEVRFCTELKSRESWFLPFNKGWNQGAGNPPNPEGLKTDYLWKQTLAPRSLTDIIEKYAQVVEETADNSKKTRRHIFPRYHQLDVVRVLLAHAGSSGVGQRYLIQHSAGSGKSNSIAWLAHQLIELERDGEHLFDSVIVVTDRLILNTQIRDTVKQFAQVSAVVGEAKSSGDLRHFLASGKKIVITTVQKFPYVLDDLGAEHRGKRFAIVIDEAHSSQGGRASSQMNQALAEDLDYEDEINRVITQRRMLPNASYFAFTATPKNRTLELFGTPVPGEDGKTAHRPFHIYSMKQAIQEGFILDVLENYTPVQSYYRLMKSVEDDPEFDIKRAQKKLRRFVEGHDHAIREKAEIMIDHFHDHAWQRKIGGQARAMIVTNGVERAISYFEAVTSYLIERRSPIKAIVAFAGEFERGDVKVTEASLNGFPSVKIPERFKQEPYRLLIVADKFQTGFDEPLLHTMYVDKALSGIKAVQTLSRVNRAHPKKSDTFALDFYNDADTIQASFAAYYRTTILSEETDPNRLHDLLAVLDGYQIYTNAQVDELVARYLAGDDRDCLDPLLDTSVALYTSELDEDSQIDFKGKAKAFVRTYGFLSAVLPYGHADWEKRSVFLNFLIPRLPAPEEQDLSRGILETIDMESYRVEVWENLKIMLLDEDATINPVPTATTGGRPEPELDRLSNIIKSFNDQFGNIEWQDPDKIRHLITEELPARVAADPAYQNAMAQGDRQNARLEHDRALQGIITGMVADHTELFKQFMDNDAFKRWLSESSFVSSYQKPLQAEFDQHHS
jgi:type I restriction enzyme, R subunit